MDELVPTQAAADMGKRRLGMLDRAGSALGALLYRKDRFFGRSLDAPSLRDAVPTTTVEVQDLQRGVVHLGEAAGPAGQFSCAYLVHRWDGPEAPTVLFVHGSGEQPWTSPSRTAASARRLFASGDGVNLIVLRAPFHNGSQRQYIQALGDLRNYVGMLASSAALLEALVRRLRAEGAYPVLAVGLSLGGWAVNLHRAYHCSADRYVPMIAGARLHEVFISSTYRWMTAADARARPELLESVLDFEADFRANSAEDCDPLLARHDRLVEFDAQRRAYEGMALRTMNKGHFTGMAATSALRAHVRQSLGVAERRPPRDLGRGHV